MVTVVQCPEDPFRTEAPLPRAVGALVANGSPHWRISLQDLPEVKESGLAYICDPLFGRQPATKDQELWGYNWSPCLSWEKLGPELPTGSVQVFAVSVSHSAFLPAQACSLDHLQSSSRTLANRLWHTHLHPRFYFLGRLICDSLLECMLKMKKTKT